jgi:hypothetical protein
MTDIVERLRASVTQCRAVDRSELLAVAAAEIARLRGDADVARLRLEAAHAEIARLRLTDAEWEAIEFAADHLDNSGWGSATLRGLLKR